MGKYLSGKALQQAVFKRTEGYAANVRKIYQDSLGKIIDIVKGTELEEGTPFSFSAYGYSEEVTPILRSMYSKVYKEIKGGAKKEWMMAADNNDELVKSIFGVASIEDHRFARFFQRNLEAMDSLFARKERGLNLSQKVWRYTEQLKTELEDSLALAIGEGTPANRLATKIQQYLQDPDRFYRRFRVKIGEDENGQPIYGRIWKRRIWSAADQSYKWIDDDPRKYHPGKGMYRSSYRNAQRLARTETNIAYRSSDYERWQQLPFVIGIEICLSNNHPVPDICDDLKGVYPPGTKFTGFHPNCRCYAKPVLADKATLDKMLEKIMDDENPAEIKDPGIVNEPPGTFRAWMRDNQERYEKAKGKGTLGYFFKDNQSLVEKAIYGLSPAEKKALSYSDKLVDPLAILKKYGADGLDNLYSAVSAKLSTMLQGTLQQQKNTLEFEINWVKQYKKYATWEEATAAYQKALDKVNLQIQKEEIKNLAAGVDNFLADHPGSKVVKKLKKQIQEALDADDLTTAKNLINFANSKVEAYNTQQAKKAIKASVTESTTDIEAYCDENRTFESKVWSQEDFNKFQPRMIKDTQKGWLNGSHEARQSIIDYTNGDYYSVNKSYYLDHTGCEQGKLMSEIIDHCVLSEDTVLRRGTDFSELGSIFGDEFKRLLDAGDVAGLNKLAGCKGVNEGFISTSFDMKGGFSGAVDLRIYAPKGTQAIYAKPISIYGDQLGKEWNAMTARTDFLQGRENEVVVNRGYQLRFVKAEPGQYHGSNVTIYVELLTRDARAVI